ncbi:MAG TPA: TetR family transcriptional regulator [Mycobacteriales bacterium]|nr:TetR family transcriptional regulator [Mycobacteriales bacterium]
MSAAREIFARDGYVAARINDISQRAEVATGSFYTYFNNKAEIFTAVFDAVQEEMLHPRIAADGAHDDIVAHIEANNRAYLELYRSNAALMAVIEQMVTVNDEFRAMRRERGRAFAARNARSISRLQAQGLADPDLDADVAARAISGMVSRLAYATFVLEDDVPFETLVATTTRLWVNALRIPVGEAPTAAGGDGVAAAAHRHP